MTTKTVGSFFDNLLKETEAELEDYRPPPGQVSRPMQLLINDLEACRDEKNTKTIDALIENARQEKYHDMLEAFGHTTLLQHLQYTGLPPHLAQNVIDGKYEAELTDRYTDAKK